MNLVLRNFFSSASLWAMVGVALRVGSGLLTLPLALRVLSSSELGLYYTFIGFTGLVSLLDFGFSQTISRSAAFAMGGAKEFQAIGVPESCGSGSPNWRLFAELFEAVQLWYRGAGALLAVLLLIPGSFVILPMIQKAGLPISNLYCWWFFAVVSTYSFVTTYWPGLLFGIGSVKSSVQIGLVAQLIGLIILITGLYSGWGLWSYGISGLVSSVITRIRTKKALHNDACLAFSVSVDRFRRNIVISRLWPMAWRQGVVMLGAFLIQRGNTLICSAKLGLQETASYGLSLNLLNLLFQVAIIPLGLAWPTIGMLRIDRDFTKIRQIFFLRLYGGLIVAAVVIALMAVWGSSLLKLFGTNTTLLSSSMFAVLGVVLWLECHHSQYGSLILSENKNPFIWPAILSGAAIFSLSWWASGKWGVLGMILAQGTVQLAWNNWWTVVRALKGLKSYS
jgi:hypothetical protein